MRQFHSDVQAGSNRVVETFSATEDPAVRDDPSGLQDQRSRLRLLAWTVLGIACLLASHWNQPEVGPLFAFPAGLLGWVWLLCGVVGLWLVPGLWLSAVLMRTGAGLSAWLGTRIGTTLAWYAAVGPMIHHHGQGARVTTAGILIATVTATAAVSLGVLLGLSRWPAQTWQRLFVPAVIGVVVSQSAIWLLMRTWTYDMNYSHIRRLDWLIVLSCALLVSVGVTSRPKLPPRRTLLTARNMTAFLGVVAATAAALMVTNHNWSPAQRMPSAIGIEPEPAPTGADVAFSLTPIGAEGPEMVRRAEFVASDEVGRPLVVHTRPGGAAGGTDSETLLVVLDRASEPVLCRPGRRAKIAMTDQVSGVRVQAVIPDGWCTR